MRCLILCIEELGCLLLAQNQVQIGVLYSHVVDGPAASGAPCKIRARAKVQSAFAMAALRRVLLGLAVLVLAYVVYRKVGKRGSRQTDSSEIQFSPTFNGRFKHQRLPQSRARSVPSEFILNY